MGKEATLLYSGGMDSTLILHQCLAEYRSTTNRVKNDITTVHAVSFAYGQRHGKELVYATRYLKQFENVSHQIVHLDFDWLKCSLLSDNRSFNPDDCPIVPGRNSIMISIAASVAMQRGSDLVFIGANKTDLDLFPDCRSDYLRGIGEALLKQGNIHLIAPLMGMTKSEIADAGTALGIDWAMTWSCYKGEKEPCGQCVACKERTRAGV